MKDILDILQKRVFLEDCIRYENSKDLVKHLLFLLFGKIKNLEGRSQMLIKQMKLFLGDPYLEIEDCSFVEEVKAVQKKIEYKFEELDKALVERNLINPRVLPNISLCEMKERIRSGAGQISTGLILNELKEITGFKQGYGETNIEFFNRMRLQIIDLLKPSTKPQEQPSHIIVGYDPNTKRATIMEGEDA